MFENMPMVLILGQDDAPGDPGGAPLPGAEGQPVEGAGGDTQTTQATDAEDQPVPAPPGGLDPLLLMALVFLVVLFGMTMFNQRKEKKRRAEMLGSLKKNDKVVTIGGVIGTIVDIRQDEGAVILKVDESNNTRIKYTHSAIQGVFGDEATTEK